MSEPQFPSIEVPGEGQLYARLHTTQGNIVVQAEPTKHSLAEARNVWNEAEALGPEAAHSQASALAPSLELSLRLIEPREVLVETVNRRDHIVPIRYRDSAWKQLVTAAGPDRISGGSWDQVYAREYFRCVTVEGQLVWLFRDAKQDRWFLHGYWD